MREEELFAIFPFWEKMKRAHKELLCKDTKHFLMNKGERLSCSDGPYGCFYVRRGGFSALLLGDTDTETEIFRVKRDQFCVLDYSAVCGQELSGIEYRAATNADVYLIEKEAFSQLIKSNFGFAERTLKDLLSVIPILIGAIEQRDYYSLEKRILGMLLEESTRQRSNTLLLTHSRIASKIGSAREVVTKKLHVLEEEGLLSCSRGRIALLNKDKIKKKIQ